MENKRTANTPRKDGVAQKATSTAIAQFQDAHEQSAMEDKWTTNIPRNDGIAEQTIATAVAQLQDAKESRPCDGGQADLQHSKQGRGFLESDRRRRGLITRCSKVVSTWWMESEPLALQAWTYGISQKSTTAVVT